MSNSFFEKPILNSPYYCPTAHEDLDEDNQPTERVIPERRTCSYITPDPRPKKKRGKKAENQPDLFEEKPAGVSVEGQIYDPTSIINEVRSAVETWRGIKDPKNWGVTPETARLLQHWRHHKFTHRQPFFCQVEAAEDDFSLVLADLLEVQRLIPQWGGLAEAVEPPGTPATQRRSRHQTEGKP